MNMMSTSKPFAKAQMVVRKPVHEVFEAFVDPDMTTRFWFTKSSGRLEAGKNLRWDWDTYGLSTDVSVKQLALDERIVFEWGVAGDRTTAELTFSGVEGGTFVRVAESGSIAEGETLLEKAIVQTGGWALVLAALKALLEHGVVLRVIADHQPVGAPR